MNFRIISMKLHKILVIYLFMLSGSTYAIKESSKNMLLECFPPSLSPYANEGVLFIRKFGSVKQAINKLPMLAPADKYADLMFRMADLILKDSMYLEGYPDLALAMCEAIEKLSHVEKVGKDKIKKARVLKIKIAQELERRKQQQEIEQKEQAQRVQNTSGNRVILNIPDLPANFTGYPKINATL